MKRIPAFTALLLLLPLPSFAQVVINEVMYNPAGSDSGREWIELYNQGSSDVTMVAGSGKASWRISDGSNHTLIDPSGGTGRGSLTIPAGGYLVIASDPTDFTSGEYPGGSYSVVKSSLSLSNNGSTISLLDGTGAILDTVAYSPTQGGSDDGSSLQRQPDGSWIAALPTPGAANSSIPYVAPASAAPDSQQTAVDASSTDQSTGQPQTPETAASYIPPPAPSLYADAGADRTVLVGADVEFDASAYDKTQNLIDPSTVRFIWNFGDGASAEGESVLHHFSYPGRYAVVLTIANNKNAAIARIAADAQPAALSFSLLPDGGVAIENLAGRDLDLSGWIVRADSITIAAQFMLPQNSKLLAGASMNIASETLAFRASSSTMLEYPNGSLALAMGASSAASSSTQQPEDAAASVASAVVNAPASVLRQTAVPEPAASAAMPEDAPPDPNDDPVATLDESSDQPSDATSTVLETASAVSASTANYFWWLGIGALALAAVATLIASGYFKKDEWGIIEDHSE